MGSTITPNYLDNSTSNVGPWCSCSASGNHREQCDDFLEYFHDNVCLKKAMLTFGNGTDKQSSTGAANQPDKHSPTLATPNNHIQRPATTVPGITMETKQNVLRAHIPTQVNENDRLWGDDGEDSTLLSPGLLDHGTPPLHLSTVGWTLPLGLSLLLLGYQ
eukprot:XP_014067398.1 PREDICTED: GDNF family receptor alpha-4-like [Salmo salar]